MFTEEQKDEIKKVIDRGSWKHSWHMIKNNTYGGIDWVSIDNLKKMQEICENEKDYAINLATRATNALTWLNDEIRDIAGQCIWCGWIVLPGSKFCGVHHRMQKASKQVAKSRLIMHTLEAKQ